MEPTHVDLLWRSLPLLLKGAALSLQILLFAGALSLCLGGVVGVLTCQRLKYPGIAFLLEGVAFVLRAVPFYVQLLIAYFVLPDVLNVQIEAFTASVIALALCSSGYSAQVVRCGINSIAKEQWEAADTLGYSTFKTLRYVIFPQMIRNILPALTNEFDSLLKSTAILASIGLLELTRMGMNIISREMDPVTIYLEVAAFYILISGAINLFSKWLERRLRYVNS
jgi:His/Glu/Gln/Arg/opine family amino acid ABC transporter permease subunit